MKFNDVSGVEFDTPVHLKGPVTISGTVTTTPSSPATASYMVKRWVSDLITEDDIAGGAASEAITVANWPVAAIPIAGYIVASEAATSSSGDTTGLTASLGVSGATSGYLAAGTSLIGATGRQQNATGTLLGSYRSNDTLLLTITATGGSPDTADIDNLALRVVFYYLEVSAEA